MLRTCILCKETFVSSEKIADIIPDFLLTLIKTRHTWNQVFKLVTTIKIFLFSNLICKSYSGRLKYSYLFSILFLFEKVIKITV